jgi:hypothetical protein
VTEDKSFPQVDIDEIDNTLFDAVNRGGLYSPSDSLFIICILIYHIFLSIQNDPSSMEKLCTSENSRNSFIDVVRASIRASCYSEEADLTCEAGHSVLHDASICMFNIIAKALVKEWKPTRQHNQSTKIRKLTSF